MSESEYQIDPARDSDAAPVITVEQLLSQLPTHWSKLLAVLVRVLVWGLLFAVLYVLRSFFLLIFLTFVFAYLQSHAEILLSNKIRRRGLRVTIVGMAFLGVLAAIGTVIIPRVIDQAALVADSYPKYIQLIDEQIIALSETYPVLEALNPTGEVSADEHPHPNNSPTLMLIHQTLGLGEAAEGRESIRSTLELLRNIGAPLIAVGSAFLLSLLFSFLIVLDLPRLTQSVRGLAHTKVGFVYDEVAGSIRDFAKVLGHALQAQVIIATINTVLTCLVIYILGIGSKVAFLSLIVFICGFIPVAGVFISSVPICLLVLHESGVSGVFLAVILIWLIHLIEAYVLNPRVFGQRLQANPVLVLIIVTIAGKLFHMWGLVLGLPVCTYFFGYAIRYRKDELGAE